MVKIKALILLAILVLVTGCAGFWRDVPEMWPTCGRCDSCEEVYR